MQSNKTNYIRLHSWKRSSNLSRIVKKHRKHWDKLENASATISGMRTNRV